MIIDATRLTDINLLLAQVPEAEDLSYSELVKLARERNEQAAQDLEADVLNLESAARTAKFAELGYIAKMIDTQRVPLTSLESEIRSYIREVTGK